MRAINISQLVALLFCIPAFAVAKPPNSWQIERVSVSRLGEQGNSFSVRPELSTDGRYVAFVSMANNFVPGTPSAAISTYVRDRKRQITRVASVDKAGWYLLAAADPAISADGHHLLFAATSKNGVRHVYWRDLINDELKILSQDAQGALGANDSATPSVSSDGAVMAFSSSAALTPECSDGIPTIYIWQKRLGKLRCINRTIDGNEPNGASLQPSVSGDGHFIAFSSSATNLVSDDDNRQDDIFLYNLATSSLQLISLGPKRAAANGQSREPSISSNGSKVAYISGAQNLVEKDENRQEDVFVWNRADGFTQLASQANTGAQANYFSSHVRISGNGRYVVFLSPADNLVPGQNNGKNQIFLRDLLRAKTDLISLGIDGKPGNGDSFQPAISSDGLFIAFRSNAKNLVPSDTNLTDDVFIAERPR
jgi:Tol biopolymer transport system component